MPSSSSPLDWQPTRVIKWLAPTPSGALRLAQRHGSRWVCVRHRVTPDGLQRVTTVERGVSVDPQRRRHAAELDETVALRLDLTDRAHRAALQRIGARWDAGSQRWRVARREALALGLADRIVRDASL